MTRASDLYPRTYYPYLDGFRALSILWVVGHHIYVFFDLQAWTASAWLPAVMAAKLGLLGVDMFFVISGFLITGLLLPDLDNTVRIKRFYLRRIFKIIPSYTAALAGGLIMLSVIGDRSLVDYGNFHIINGQTVPYTEMVPQPFSPALLGRYFVFLQNYTADHIVTLAHTWSIAIEEHFYLGYPLIFWLACRCGKDMPARRRALILLLVAVFLAAHLYRFVHIAYLHTLNNQATPARIDALIIGCLMRILEPRWRRAVSGRTFWTGALCCAAGLLGYGLIFALSYEFAATGVKTVGGGLAYYLLIYLAPALLILAALTGFRPLVRPLSHPWLIAIGKHSYGTYLWHYVLIFPFALLQDRFSPGILIGLYLPTALLAGWISTGTLERRFLDLRRRYCP